jgi:V/A-type H+/Na+-transporting ATPase subunit C
MSPSTATRHNASGRKDYGYGNARVRGMRSRLLKQAFFEDLMAATDVSRTIQLLSDTEYRTDLDEALIHGRTAAAVDEALKNNMVRTFQKVMAFLNDEAYDLMGTLLGRFDLFNIKTIIRGKHMHLEPEEIEDSLLALGQLTPVELKELTRQDDARAVADTLWVWDSPYAKPLLDHIAEYQREHDLALLELALDKHYSEWAASRLKKRSSNVKLARRILGLQTDSINLLSVFRLLKSDIGDMDPARFYLPGGLHVTEPLFIELAGLSDVDEVLDRLRRTPYGSQLEAVVVTYVEEGSLSVFERALEDFVMRKALSSGQGDPLGFGIIMSYLWAKQNEVTNLRIIVKGKSVGMPPDRVRKELIVV